MFNLGNFQKKKKRIIQCMMVIIDNSAVGRKRKKKTKLVMTYVVAPKGFECKLFNSLINLFASETS